MSRTSDVGGINKYRPDGVADFRGALLTLLLGKPCSYQPASFPGVKKARNQSANQKIMCSRVEISVEMKKVARISAQSRQRLSPVHVFGTVTWMMKNNLKQDDFLQKEGLISAVAGEVFLTKA